MDAVRMDAVRMDVIRQLSADAAVPSLGDRVLPGRPVRRLRRLDAERPDGRDYGAAELGVAIEDEEAWSLVGMPANHGVGLHDDEDICPPRPEPAKEDPEESIRDRQAGPRAPLPEDGDLLTEGEILEGEVDAITEKRAEAVRGEDDEPNHGSRMADLGLLGNVEPVERALRGQGRPISNHQHCRLGIEFCRTTRRSGCRFLEPLDHAHRADGVRARKARLPEPSTAVDAAGRCPGPSDVARVVPRTATG